MSINNIIEALAVLCAVVLGFLSNIWFNHLQDRKCRERELKCLFFELFDLHRHFNASVIILEKIDLNKGIPSIMHFQKLSVLETSILMSKDAFRYRKGNISKDIFEFRTVMRNTNIEIQAVVDYVKTGDVDKVVLQNYIDQVKSKAIYLVNKGIPNFINGNEGYLTPIMRKKLSDFEQIDERKKADVAVVYENHW